MENRKSDILAGAFAGAVGGVAGGAVKQICEKIAPPRKPWRQPPPGILAAKFTRAVADEDLTKTQREKSANVIHWVFSIATAALYGAVVEVYPRARAGNGSVFGLVVWAGLHEITLPLLGGTPPIEEVPASEQINEFVTHAIYGVTVDAVRGLLRSSEN